ncbi:uncharacterized protein si:dkey-261h17.1 isoform X2 [Oryzias melastigma]|nr:uncharacterized protein si:dkey-261h17.1 isoform X2 [Oryzias melastigma]
MGQEPTTASATGTGPTGGGDTQQPHQTPAAPTDSSTTASQNNSTAVTVLNGPTFNIEPAIEDSGKDPTGVQETPHPTLKVVVPNVNCVANKEDLQTSTVEAEVEIKDCEETKKIIEENPAGWCPQDSCQLTLYQDGTTLMVSSNDTEPGIMQKALQSESLKNNLGVKKTEIPTSSRSVFVGLLVTGLLVAIAVTVGYFKCQRRPAAKGAGLAQEASPVDPENQGNTLASEAPLNPPPETQEKPNINGESPEAEKTQSPPPTNGHSNAKTADTEL